MLAALGTATACPAASVPVSAFAGNVGGRSLSTDPAGGTTLYVVPDGRMLLVTDILVANHGQEAGPLYLADSQGTRCAVALLQQTLINNAPPPMGFTTLSNVHTTFATGIPFGPGEPVIATLAGGSRGVDVTITGTLVPGPRRQAVVRLPGGAREAPHDTSPAPVP
jgi:hypothetical protein